MLLILRPFNVSFVSNNVLGKGLIVQINGGNDLVVGEDGAHYFSLKLKNGDFFELRVKNQPSGPNQLCEFNKLAGEVGSETTLELTLTCSLVAYKVGGKFESDPDLLRQLVILVNNYPVNIEVDGFGNFRFANEFDDHSELEIKYAQFPDKYACTINGMDSLVAKVDGGVIENLVIDCNFSGFSAMTL